MLMEVKKLCTKLVVILNNDNWLRHKKGYVFMAENDRAEIIQALFCVFVKTAKGAIDSDNGNK
jgi:glycerol-3-phosphate cytidylyltransferase-like family protein